MCRRGSGAFLLRNLPPLSEMSAARSEGELVRKLDEKKQERLKYERRLQSNLEHYVTRAVNELTYAVPLDDGGDPTATLELLRRVPTAGEEGIERRYYEPL